MDSLSEFVPAVGDGSYVAERQSVLTDERWRWLWRQHKTRFIEAGAAILLGGQVHVHPARADAVIVDLGRTQVARQVEAE